MSTENEEKTPSNAKYTIFHALHDVMNEKKPKKSIWARILNRSSDDK